MESTSPLSTVFGPGRRGGERRRGGEGRGGESGVGGCGGEGGVSLPCDKSWVSYLGFNCGSVINLTSAGKKKQKKKWGGLHLSISVLIGGHAVYFYLPLSLLSLQRYQRAGGCSVKNPVSFPKKQSHLGRVFKEQTAAAALGLR